MAKLLRDRLFLAWALLAAVTVLSSLLGGGGPAGRGLSASAISFAVLAMAFAKAFVVMFEFMELRHAPRALKLIAVLWLCGALALLLLFDAGLLSGFAQAL